MLFLLVNREIRVVGEYFSNPEERLQKGELVVDCLRLKP